MNLVVSILSLTLIINKHIHAFGIPSPFKPSNTFIPDTSISAKYGPPDDNGMHGTAETVVPTAEQREKFISVFQQVMECQVREHLPSILTSNIDLLVQLRGEAGVNLIHEQVANVEATGDEELIQRAYAAVEYIVYFLEAFVGEAKVLDDNNKQLLGKILRCMTENDDESSLSRQEKLDALMKEEKGNFTPGFLRYLEGECTRITNAKKMDKETTKLLEVMRMIQTRIIEELGQELGEGAQVLGQLLGYESNEERMAVLDAGLKVRGKGFATELKAMTEEALQGFQNVPGGVDPGLVSIITDVDSRIQEFISSN